MGDALISWCLIVCGVCMVVGGIIKIVNDASPSYIVESCEKTNTFFVKDKVFECKLKSK